MAKRVDQASRRMKAAPSEVYQAFSSAKAMLAWLPPEGMRGEMMAFDFREGGKYRLRLHYTGGEAGKTGEGFDEVEVNFVKLEQDRHIAQAVRFKSENEEFAGEMIMKWDFEKAGTGTMVSIRCEDVPPGISREDHQVGLASSLDNLAEYVEGKRR